jgi:RimJ/RimL family protein N-acetyltransferase
MGRAPEIRTERLLLRRWRAADKPVFAEMNRDPRVMEFFASALTAEESDAMVNRIEAAFDGNGFGLWAVEAVGPGTFLGFVGLSVPQFDAPFMPAVEVGWRLAADAWGHGYATEAASASLAFGFETAGLDEIVSFATVGNTRSRRVMERIGMTHDPADDFDYPRLPVDSPLRPHVLYRIRRPASPTSA